VHDLHCAESDALRPAAVGAGRGSSELVALSNPSCDPVLACLKMLRLLRAPVCCASGSRLTVLVTFSVGPLLHQRSTLRPPPRAIHLTCLFAAHCRFASCTRSRSRFRTAATGPCSSFLRSALSRLVTRLCNPCSLLASESVLVCLGAVRSPTAEQFTQGKLTTTEVSACAGVYVRVGVIGAFAVLASSDFHAELHTSCLSACPNSWSLFDCMTAASARLVLGRLHGRPLARVPKVVQELQVQQTSCYL
jgi:hypothetical protein